MKSSKGQNMTIQEAMEKLEKEKSLPDRLRGISKGSLDKSIKEQPPQG